LKNSDLSGADLKSKIREKIKGRVVIAGIGNIIRGDDGLGPKLIEILKSKNANAALFDCGTAPENYIFPILSAPSDTVILIDAADIGLTPGGIKVLNLEDISGVSFSTHNPSPRLFTDLLKTGKEDLNIFVISMQPKTTALGSAISQDVLEGLRSLSDALVEALG